MPRRATVIGKVLGFGFALTAALFAAAFEPALAATTSPWLDVPQAQARSLSSGERLIKPLRYRTVRLDWTGLDAILDNAPLESLQRGASSGPTLSLPLADGSFARFSIEESPIMDAAMAASLPDVKTYRGVGIDDPSAVVRFDKTPAGFHAMIRSEKGFVFIDPYARGETDLYVVYDKRDFDVPADELPVCRVGDPDYYSPAGVLPPLDFGKVKDTATRVVQNGANFKTIRLAVAATGEYTVFHGGTVALAQAAITTTINRVNEIYEHDLAIRMILVNAPNIIFTDGTTDPYSNNCDGAELDINQATLDDPARLGAANYDLGHVMGGPGGGGGVAGPGPCAVNVNFQTGVANSHAQGCTGSGNPINDPFDIDFVAHEIGHQWGAPHTFNGSLGSCDGNRDPNAAYEPGSGTTIMGYAGICNTDNVQPNSNAYFHGSSLETIAGYDPATRFGVANCIVQIASNNTPPTVEAGVPRNIPRGTPFELCGVGNDVDAGNNVTFLWEEFDLGPAAGPPNNPNSPPFFRSFTPTANACRTFPQLNDILTNTPTFGEILPQVAIPMTFRLTVFDNNPGNVGGAFNQDEVVVTVDANSGPFQVTSQNAATNWNAGDNQIVTWDVANTTAAPVNCPNVDVSFSTDGGQTFPTVLAAATANDGTEQIVVPVGDTTTGRVKVQCSNNVFFDINNANITVGGGGGACIDDNFETPGEAGAGGTDDACFGTDLGAIPAAQTHAHCDEDWVYFNATGGTTYRIETTNLTGGADTQISVHDNCGLPLATDDNGGTGQGSLLQFTPQANTAVDIRIFDPNNAYGAGKGYTINVTEAGACPQDLNLANQTVTAPQVFIANNQITTGPTFLVDVNGNATLRAGNSIILRDGTTVRGALTANLTPNPCGAGN